MATVLNINDNNLLLQKGTEMHRSQGYAWLKDGAVYFDFDDADNAVAACRLEPQKINSRYWQQCEQTALPSNDSGMRHAADLIWRHLNELKERYQLSELAMVVPSHYQPANLQLLLGIAQSCGLEVSALINKAVQAMVAANSSFKRVLHIDVQLHQTVCSEVSLNAGVWQLGKVEIIHEVGLQAMQDALLKAAQERFIQGDRFDPLHYAETEQQLFDQLPRLAEEIRADGKANMVVMQASNRYSCSIDARQWMAALEPFIDALKSAQIDHLPEARYYDFNGFKALWFAGPDRVTLQSARWSEDQLNLTATKSAVGDVIYLAELPVAGEAAAKHPTEQADAADAMERKPQKTMTGLAEGNRVNDPVAKTASSDLMSDNGVLSATHVMQNGRAISIDRVHISVVNNQLNIALSEASNLANLLKSDQLFVIGDAERQALEVNDRLGSNLADGVITVISVE